MFTFAAKATGGSLKTLELAKKHAKPHLHVHKAVSHKDVLRFLGQHQPKVLNIAGSREEKEPGLYAWILEFLKSVL